MWQRLYFINIFTLACVRLEMAYYSSNKCLNSYKNQDRGTKNRSKLDGEGDGQNTEANPRIVTCYRWATIWTLTIYKGRER